MSAASLDAVGRVDEDHLFPIDLGQTVQPCAAQLLIEGDKKRASDSSMLSLQFAEHLDGFHPGNGMVHHGRRVIPPPLSRNQSWGSCT